MATLFDPIVLGDLELPNRIVMAPLTRCRADEGRVPNALMAEYYAQRADAGLILSEATAVTPMGVGYPDTPGIWSDDQVRGWSNVTKAVHAAGGRIFLQLWHVGRISDPLYLNGELPVAPSAIAAEGHVSLVRPKRPYVTPRALDTEEIADIVEAYRQGAERAKAAGFDGVEIHGANGYLLDQFLQDSTNKRTDRYGGSIENRARLLLEVAPGRRTEPAAPGNLLYRRYRRLPGLSDPGLIAPARKSPPRLPWRALCFARLAQAEIRLRLRARIALGAALATAAATARALRSHPLDLAERDQPLQDRLHQRRRRVHLAAELFQPTRLAVFQGGADLHECRHQ